MEAHEEVEALRSRAHERLEALLQNAAGKSPQETAAIITELAFEPGNPVKDFFAAANGICMWQETPWSPLGTDINNSARSTAVATQHAQVSQLQESLTL